LTLTRASELLRSKAVSAVDLTCLKRITTYNPTLNAFITVTTEQALAAARQLDVEWRRGNEAAVVELKAGDRKELGVLQLPASK
jgi:Asp-tRNA(Asn)/Glu-tRNA(Gln) amidotransferase A subunit family amidase